MIGELQRFDKLIERQEDMLGNTDRANTATLRVSPDGSGADGLSWRTAYQTIQDALDAASTDPNDSTLILIAPHATFYDINTTGDPTWTGNYALRGVHRIWSAIRNEHASATSVFKFTGKVSITDLAIFTADEVNGVIFTNSGWRVRKCGFNSTGTTGANTSVYIDGSAALTRGGIMEDVQFLGNVANTRAIYINTSTVNEFYNVHVHACLTGLQIAGATSDFCTFHSCDFGDCALAIDIDAGNEQHFDNISFHHNTTNVDDEVHDHFWKNIQGQLPLTIEPDNLTGVTVAANAVANVWGTDTELRAAATSTKPFKIVTVIGQPVIAQLHELRISSDSGSTFDNHLMIESARGVATPSPSGTEFIYNVGTRISCSMKAASAGSDEMQVWLKIQEI